MIISDYVDKRRRPNDYRAKHEVARATGQTRIKSVRVQLLVVERSLFVFPVERKRGAVPACYIKLARSRMKLKL